MRANLLDLALSRKSLGHEQRESLLRIHGRFLTARGLTSSDHGLVRYLLHRGYELSKVKQGSAPTKLVWAKVSGGSSSMTIILAAPHFGQTRVGITED